MATETLPNGSELSAAALVRIEAAALEALAERLEGSMYAAFETAVERLLRCVQQEHRVIVTGVGKSGLIGRKIAATLCSTGVPAHFLHPADALHGDLGMISSGDVLMALSSSGRSQELLLLLPALQRRRTTVIALCGSAHSELGSTADIFLDASVSCEACPHNLAPTASIAVALALGDALAITVSNRRGFSPQDFAALHPGGQIGRRLARVRDLMQVGDAIASVVPATPMSEVIYEMSRKKLGMTTVVDVLADRRLLGMISDGDLRRLLQREGSNALDHRAVDIMNRDPVTVTLDVFATEAMELMEERKITSLIVVSNSCQVLGILHIHDLWKALGPQLRPPL